jgi:hypothetical protein
MAIQWYQIVICNEMIGCYCRLHFGLRCLLKKITLLILFDIIIYISNNKLFFQLNINIYIFNYLKTF